MLLLLLARASLGARIMLAAATAALSAAALPPGLWRPQLRRLGGLAAFLFFFTAIGAGAPYSTVLVRTGYLLQSSGAFWPIPQARGKAH